MITYNFRIYPDKKQQNKLWEHANKLNWLYNFFLNQKIEAYTNEKKNVKRFELQAQLPTLKSNDVILKEIHSQVLQGVCKRLDQSYQCFFRNLKYGISGFPKFRSCRNFYGICYPQSGYSLSNNIFKTKIYGEIPFKKHRDIKGNIKTVQITTQNNKWFLCITTDFKVKNNTNEKLEIGIDVGLTDLVVTSDGKHIKNIKDAKYFDKQISKVQAMRDKKKKRSRSYKHLTSVMQELYDAKNRKISDFQHKVSKRLSSQYDTIYAEDLNVKNMSEGKIRNLNKAIRNTGLSRFIGYLSYKANNLVLVNPKNTSKTCNYCGYIHKDLKLSDRNIRCMCGSEYDRDENAAKNIYCLGRAVSDLNPKRAGLVTIQEALTFM
jgi:putative transposase